MCQTPLNITAIGRDFRYTVVYMSMEPVPSYVPRVPHSLPGRSQRFLRHFIGNRALGQQKYNFVNTTLYRSARG